QVAAALLREPGVQVARAGMAMLHLAVGRHAEALLRGLVSLLLGDNWVPSSRQFAGEKWESLIIEAWQLMQRGKWRFRFVGERPPWRSVVPRSLLNAAEGVPYERTNKDFWISCARCCKV